jgi:hypothetical protein
MQVDRRGQSEPRRNLWFGNDQSHGIKDPFEKRKILLWDERMYTSEFANDAFPCACYSEMRGIKALASGIVKEP